jgi:hypothetical protein
MAWIVVDRSEPLPNSRVEMVPRRRVLPVPANRSNLLAMIGSATDVRVSRREPLENLSLPARLRVCREYCRRQRCEILGRLHEEGERAKSTDRRQLQTC